MQQTYGQYETLAAPTGDLLYKLYDLHQGLDIDAFAGEEVCSPLDGKVVSIVSATPCHPATGDTVNPYGSVTLAPTGQAGWHLTVTHLCDVFVGLNQDVVRGQKLGTVASWPAEMEKPAGIEHVHLGLKQTGAIGTYVGDPLRCLLGPFDTRPPFFHEIWDKTTPRGRIAFVRDISKGNALLFEDPASLPHGKLDILVRAGDYFTTFMPVTAYFPFFYIEPFPFPPRPVIVWQQVLLDFPGPPVAPSQLVLRIKRMTGEVVLQREIAFTGTIVAADPDPYLEPQYHSGKPYSWGWNKADCYFIMTHTLTAEGAWDTASTPSTPPPSHYEVEVEARDEAGNIGWERTFVTVP